MIAPEEIGLVYGECAEIIGWHPVAVEDAEVTYIRADLRDIEIAALKASHIEPLQSRVLPWLLECFGSEIAADTKERNHRFLEESLELVQALGCNANEAHMLVDYVFSRPEGEPIQEVGGVMITLAALCLANGLDMHAAGEKELARIWTKVKQIREKQASKPRNSPLPTKHESAEVSALKARIAELETAEQRAFTILESEGVSKERARSVHNGIGVLSTRMRKEVHLQAGRIAELEKQVLSDLDRYDAGLLNDYGGGNVQWWQDYIRGELGRAHDFYLSQLPPLPEEGKA